MRWKRVLLTPPSLVALAGLVFGVGLGAMVAGSPAHAADDDTSDVCSVGYEFLAAGNIEEAKQLFRLDLADPECARGLTLAADQQAEAAAASEACTATADEVEQGADATKVEELVAEALDHCADAVDLDASLADGLSDTITELSDASPGEPESFSLSAWWPDFWDRVQSIGTVLAQVLIVGLLALPLLNALGVVVGRWFSKRQRRWWRTRPWARAIAAAGAIGVLVLLVGSDPARFGYEFPILARLLLGGAVVFALAWVLAQRGHVSFDTFADEKGARDPGSPMGQLIATELNVLLDETGGGIDVIDPLADASFDDASVSALSGPENKIVAALLTFFRTVFQPGPAYLVTGEVIEAGSSGTGLSLRLKHGRRTIDSTVIYERTLTNVLPTLATSGDDKGGGKGDGKSGDGKDATATTTDLARPAATWVELALLREFHGDLESVPGLHGARSWRGIALRSLAAQQNQRGDVTGALASYARALDVDSDDVLTRLGFATLRTRVAENEPTSTLYASAIENLTDVAAEIETNTEVDPMVCLVAIHTGIVARLNLVAARARDDGTARSADEPVLAGVAASLAGFDRLITEAESNLERGKATSERLREFRVAHESMRPFRTKSLTLGEEVEFARTSGRTIRGAYNAASYFVTPLVRGRVTLSDMPRALELLAIATTHPKFRSYAATDPCLAPLANHPEFGKEFEKLVPPPETTPKLSSVTIIGKHFATKLEARGVTSLAGLSLQSNPDISLWTQAPTELIEEWRDLAALEAIPDLDIRHVNLLHLCGIRSVTDLAGADAGELHAKLESVGFAVAASTTSSLNTIDAWIAAASR